MNENLLRRGRIMYIIEAGIEYLISIMVANTYLALLTKELGISDSLTGIISSFISLGCVFQLCSILIRKRRSKGFVLVLSVLNQLLFISLYVVPLVGGDESFKSIFLSFAISLGFSIVKTIVKVCITISTDITIAEITNAILISPLAP